LDAVFQLFDSSLGSTSMTLLTLSLVESCVTFENARYDEDNEKMEKSAQAQTNSRKSFSSLEQEAFIAILRTADQLDLRITELLKPYNLSPTQFNALRILRGAGDSGLPCSEVGERMINHDPDITRLMDRLEKRALVQRRRSQKDRRVITARILPAGLDLLKTIDQPLEQFHRRMMGNMGEQKLKSLVQLLELARGVESTRVAPSS
jgi:DNA-binding MarR family transcriptional regulator